LNGPVGIFGGFCGESLGVELPDTVLGVRKHLVLVLQRLSEVNTVNFVAVTLSSAYSMAGFPIIQVGN
jgi:hypothetical protein